MIKRRLYRLEHGEKENGSSSSSSDSEVEVRSSEDSENEPSLPESESEPEPEPEPDSNVEADNDADNDDDDVRSPSRTEDPSCSSSGYESEDSSANEIEADSAGLPENDDVSRSKKDEDTHNGSLLSLVENGEITELQAKWILKCKSIYKCRLCPKIVCLNEESLKTHLKSKRHSRSEKLLDEGRLKRMLNSDGEEKVHSDDGETHAERHARILAMAQDASKKKGKGRQRQRLRLKRKKHRKSSNIPTSGQQTENCAKRRRKNAD